MEIKTFYQHYYEVNEGDIKDDDSDDDDDVGIFHSTARLLPKKILKGPSELNAENLGDQHMKWKVLLWKIKAPRAILWEPQATGLLLGNSLGTVTITDYAGS